MQRSRWDQNNRVLPYIAFKIVTVTAGLLSLSFSFSLINSLIGRNIHPSNHYLLYYLIHACDLQSVLNVILRQQEKRFANNTEATFNLTDDSTNQNIDYVPVRQSSQRSYA